jgi:cation transport protein ChaC
MVRSVIGMLELRKGPVRPIGEAGQGQGDGQNLRPEERIVVSESGELWVFGYGSLMWRPGFAFTERHTARLIGLHRALCVYSHVHRGTPERPGLVLGLDRGGACTGIAFRVAAADRAATIAYLREREQVTNVYLEVTRTVTLPATGARVAALTYIVDRGHGQYAGRLDRAALLHHVRQGHGKSGANADYVTATVGELDRLGLKDPALHWLADRLGRHAGAPP